MPVIAHTHGTALVGGRLRRAALETASVSLAGTTNAAVNITMNPDAFFPMIHEAAGTWLMAHPTDGGDADNPRCTIYIDQIGAQPYDFDYRYISS